MTLTPATYIRFGDLVSLSYDGTGVSSVDGGTLQPIEDFPVLNSLPEPHVFEIPGLIDAELFSINMGMVLEPCKDDGGGFNLAFIDPGDWLEYEVDVTKTGYYNGKKSLQSTYSVCTGEDLYIFLRENKAICRGVTNDINIRTSI